MALFNREDEDPDVSSPSSKPAAQKDSSGGRSTYIGPGVKIKGEISADAEVVVDGEVQGRLELRNRLIVGSEGVVDGDIVARSVQVGGRVVGNVRGIDRFELLQSGRIEGDVVSPRVVIAEGAFFKGNLEMASQQEPSAPAPGPGVPGKVKPQVDEPTKQGDKSPPGASTGTETGGPK
ncbi:MAG: polymer-forming cytoskeletal protein [Thermoanaerobaculia bacterium]|jgi:cytoskeletal protein CcmA (bactofilin family)